MVVHWVEPMAATMAVHLVESRAEWWVGARADHWADPLAVCLVDYLVASTAVHWVEWMVASMADPLVHH